MNIRKVYIKGAIMSMTLILSLILGCQIVTAQQGYRIEAHLTGLPDGPVLLKRYYDGAVLAETTSRDGRFVLKKEGDFIGEKAYLQLGEVTPRTPIYVESGRIEISGTPEAPVARGTISNDAYNSYLALITPVEKKIDSLRVLLRTEQDESRRKVLQGQLQVQYQDFFYPIRKNFAYTHNKTMLAPEFLSGGIGGLRYEAFRELVDRLHPDMEENFYLNRLKQRLEILERTDIGRELPNFTLPDTAGNSFSFDQLKGQTVLIDFWASWCAPCRAENGNLKRLYAKYKSKGFNIVAVSIDDKADRWKKAIVEDEVPWIHVSSLTGWSCPMANDYGVAYGMTGIPYSLLVGPDGRVVGFNLRGERLAEKLKELMGE